MDISGVDEPKRRYDENEVTSSSVNHDEGIDSYSVSNVVSFFREKDFVIQQIVFVANFSSGDIPLARLRLIWDEKYETLLKILERYQEQPTVLNSSLADLTEPLTGRMTEILLWAAFTPDKSIFIHVSNCV